MKVLVFLLASPVISLGRSLSNEKGKEIYYQYQGPPIIFNQHVLDNEWSTQRFAIDLSTIYAQG